MQSIRLIFSFISFHTTLVNRALRYTINYSKTLQEFCITTRIRHQSVCIVCPARRCLWQKIVRFFINWFVKKIFISYTLSTIYNCKIGDWKWYAVTGTLHIIYMLFFQFLAAYPPPPPLKSISFQSPIICWSNNGNPKNKQKQILFPWGKKNAYMTSLLATYRYRDWKNKL